MAADRPDLRRRVRHDLRSPLAVVLGRAEMLAAETYGPLTEGQRRCVDAILRGAERLQEELEQLAEDLESLSDPPPSG